MCAFIGLNPSTADEKEDDPTIRRCIGFAKKLHCDGLVMANIWSFRTKSPDELKKHEVGHIENAANLDWLQWVCRSINPVVAAWGNHGEWQNGGADVVNFLYPILASRSLDFQCLGRTGQGEPRHPLYLSKSTTVCSLDSEVYLCFRGL